MNNKKLLNLNCSDEQLRRKLENIKFLKLKIDHFAKIITEENIKTNQEVGNSVWDDFKKNGSQKLPKTRGTNEEHSIDYHFDGLKTNHNLLFYLDSFIGDIKRCIEFSIKLILKSHKINTKKFSFKEILKQILPTYEGSREKYIQFLFDKYPDYIMFIRSNLSWFKSSNELRNKITHLNPLTNTQDFSVGLVWDPGIQFTKKPRIGNIKLSLMGMDKSILSLVNEYVDNLNLFLERTLELRKDIFQDRYAEKLF